MPSSRLDYRLLQDGAITLYWRGEVFEEDLSWLVTHAYRIHRWDAATWRSDADVHDALARELQFPEYYGRNLDALNDCLSDPNVIPVNWGIALAFERFDAFARRSQKTAQTILDIMENVSRGRLLFGQHFIVLVQSDDPAIEFHPVGARPVNWNQREWLKKNRQAT